MAFLGAIYARTVAAPLNPAYRPVSVALRGAQWGGTMHAGLQNEERVLIGLLLAWPGSVPWWTFLFFFSEQWVRAIKPAKWNSGAGRVQVLHGGLVCMLDDSRFGESHTHVSTSAG